MDITAFKNSLAADTPPPDLRPPLAALWYVAKGHWQRAHELAQEQDDQVGAWVHAYLHRVEGDQENAGYWYRRAGQPHCRAPLDDEWAAIAVALLGRQAPAR